MIKRDKLKILVSCHKPDPCIISTPPYYPIQVGAALQKGVDLGFVKDDEGDNISYKNRKYCEWTALYWGWKNIKDVDYLGLCHYRRYFDIDFSNNKIDMLLRKSDILILEERVSSVSNFEVFCPCVGQDNAVLLVDTLLTLYPDALQSSIDYLLNCNHFVLCSMFVARKEIYDDLCRFVFTILETYEKKLPEMPYTRLNRTIGYAGELLLGLYVKYRNLKPLKVPMRPMGANVNTYHKSAIKRAYNNIIFCLRNLKKHTEFSVWPEIRDGFKQDGIVLSSL